MNILIPPQNGFKSKDGKIFILFLLFWFLVNALQAYFLGLEGDEAYYWHLSQHIDWSYFDHPPMVAVLIRLGESFGHAPFFTRLGTVLVSTLSVGLIFEALPDYLKNIRWYILVCSATLLINVYSFITTPDAPLLFFASLFLLTYKRFLNRQSVANSIILGLCMAGMFYSKYHGILLVIFVVLSNLKILLNKYFWMAVIVTIILFVPHIYWQYTHDWPSLRFHLNERLARHYKINFTTDYLGGQILVFGPLISLFFYATCYKLKIKDQLIRTHLFVFVGTLVFFLVSSLKNTVEAHWTLIAVPSFLVLLMHLVMNGTEKYQRVFYKFAIVNIMLILLARVLFFIPNSPFLLIKNYYPFFYGKQWAITLFKAAEGKPVVFENSYVLPSLYQYYNDGAVAIGYNTKSYRKTNFNLEDDCKLSGQNVLRYVGGRQDDTALKYIDTKYADGTLVPIHQYSCVNTLKIASTNVPKNMKADSIYNITITIENRSDKTITFYNNVAVDYAFFVAKYDFVNSVTSYKLDSNLIKPYEKKFMNIQLQAPINSGKYKLLFSIKSEPFVGNFASSFYQVVVE